MSAMMLPATWRRPTGFSDPECYEEPVTIVGFCYGRHRDGNTNASALAVEMDCDWGFDGDSRYGSPVSAFAELWDSLNAKRGFAWDTNPWVVAVTFTVQVGNIDTIGETA